MNGTGDRTSELGRFAAREMLARLQRETGETWSPHVIDRMLFMYEMGYLRGRSDAALEAMEMYERSHASEGREAPDEPKSDPESEPKP